MDRALTALELLRPLRTALAALPQFDLSGESSTLQRLVGAALLPASHTPLETFSGRPEQTVTPEPEPLRPDIQPVRLPGQRRRPDTLHR